MFLWFAGLHPPLPQFRENNRWEDAFGRVRSPSSCSNASRVMKAKAAKPEIFGVKDSQDCHEGDANDEGAEDSRPDWRNLPLDIICTIVSLLHLRDGASSVGCIRLVNRHWCAAACQGMQLGVLRAAGKVEPGETINWAVGSFPFLQCLDLKRIGRTIRDIDMHTIGSLSQLTSINMSMCWNVTSKGLDGLGGLQHLKYLAMKECIAVHDLSGIRNLQSLVSLDASHCDGLLDDGLATVPELRALSKLVIYRCRKISNNALQSLALMPQLLSLNIGGCGLITHEGLTALTGLSGLESLGLGNDAYETHADTVGDEGLVHVSHLEGLKYLDLCFRYKISNQGLGYLSKLESLKELNLAKCKRISDQGVAVLTALSNLTSLSMWGCVKVSDLSLESLTVLKSLQHIDLSQCTRVTDGGVPTLKSLTRLAHLNLNNCKRITPEGLSSLRDLTSLTSLIPPSKKMLLRNHHYLH